MITLPLNPQEKRLLDSGQTHKALRLMLDTRQATDMAEVITFLRTIPGYATLDTTQAEDIERGQTLFPFADLPESNTIAFYSCPHCSRFLTYGKHWQECLARHIIRQHPAKFWQTPVDKLTPTYHTRESLGPLDGITLETIAGEAVRVKPITFPPRFIPLQQPRNVPEREINRPDDARGYSLRWDILEV